MATVYCEILENVFEKTSLSRNALMALCNGVTPRFAQSTIKSLETSGYVRVVERKITDKSREKKTQYYFITPAGVRFLRESAIQDENIKYDSKKKTRLPWLKYIDEESTKKMAILGDVSKNRDRVFAVGEAAMISELAGATIPFFVQDPDSPIKDVSEQRMSNDDTYALQMEMEQYAYTDMQLKFQKMNARKERARKADPRVVTSKTASEVMEGAVINWQKAEGGNKEPTYWSIRETMNYTHGDVQMEFPSEAEDYIRYVHPSTIKYVALMNYRGNEVLDKHDTDRGRFSGMLQSRVRSLLLYPVHKPTLNWPSQFSLAEHSADQKWKERLKPEFKERSVSEGTCGALLIQSPARFRRIWRDPIRPMQTKTELGFMFSHLYVEEIGRNGANNLRDIMLTGTDEYKARELARVLEEGFGESIGVRFVKNSEVHGDLFPVKAKLGDTWFYFAIGTWIDIRQTERIISQLRKDTSFGVGVICEKWQHGYYKVMMPEAVTYWPGKTPDEITDDYYGQAPEADDETDDELSDETVEIIEDIDEE